MGVLFVDQQWSLVQYLAARDPSVADALDPLGPYLLLSINCSLSMKGFTYKCSAGSWQHVACYCVLLSHLLLTPYIMLPLPIKASG